jgi:serine/threonine-protein kinase
MQPGELPCALVMTPTKSQPECLVRPGDRLAGRYRIERKLGSGGMGVVFAARHEELGELFAVKLMRVQDAELEETSKRFLREARAAARLRNEHVARVVDAGKDESGRQYLVMEYLKGRNLGDVLHERGALPLDEAVGYVLQACVGVAEAHRQGIIHRDLKPENLFLTKQADRLPLVKVLDFGISKLLPGKGMTGADSVVTSPSLVMGSPGYTSPEQLRTPDKIDVRTDVWSLGVILYKLLSGTMPFAKAEIADVMVAVISEEPPPLATLSSPGLAIPLELSNVVARAMAKDAEQRFGSVAELAIALRPWAPRWAAEAPLRAANILGQSAILAESAAQVRSPEPVEAPQPDAAPNEPLPSAPEKWRGRLASLKARIALGATLVLGGLVASQILRNHMAGSPAAETGAIADDPVPTGSAAAPAAAAAAAAGPSAVSAAAAAVATPANEAPTAHPSVTDGERGGLRSAPAPAAVAEPHVGGAVAPRGAVPLRPGARPAAGRAPAALRDKRKPAFPAGDPLEGRR